MPYGQILELMVALILLESAPDAASKAFSAVTTFVLFLFCTIVWTFFCCWNAERLKSGGRAIGQGAVEWLALLPLVADFYFLELGSLVRPIGDLLRLPSVVEIIGVAIFLLYLFISWFCQERVLGSKGETSLASARAWRRFSLLLPILLPYLVITILADIFQALPYRWIQEVFSGPMGSLVLFALLMVFFLLFLPKTVKWLWRCKPLPESSLRQTIEKGLEKQGIRFSDILVWPVGEAMACTAAVIGIVPGFRYVLLTPCLINYLSTDEIEAVVAHEAEHVRRKHLIWYVFFLACYSLVMFSVSEPILTFFMSKPWFLKFIMNLDSLPPSVTSLLAAILIGLLTFGYFRFIMGFFMRNFERQADLSVFKVQGQPFSLINALRKVAFLSGMDPSRPNWHHFSIAERIDFLEMAYKNKNLIEDHNRRLMRARTVFVGISTFLILLPFALPTKAWKKEAKVNSAYILYERFVKKHKNDPMWLLQVGGLFFENGMYQQAEQAYKEVLKMEPENPEAMNNLAWLYLKAKDEKYLHPRQALLLAMAAARIKSESHILDTLAESYFINGYIERAVDVEKIALKKAKQNRAYYQKQLERFRNALKKTN